MNRLIILTFLLVNVFLCSAAKSENEAPIPCQDDDDCKYFSNGACVKQFCMCNGTSLCPETVHTVVTKIGENCTKTEECNIDHAECQNRTCTCQSGFVKATNGRKCLLISGGIGEICEDSVQCYTKTNHSVCRNNECVCEGMHEVDGSCFKNVVLGGSCQHDAECSINKFSLCLNSICTCKNGYIGGLNNSECFQTAKGKNSSCVDDLQCTVPMGNNSHCISGVCSCKELYHYKEKLNKCVIDKMYGETCKLHSDCHEPFQKDSRLECIYGECKCRSGFKEKHGICLDASGSVGITASLCLPIFIFILKQFF